MPRLFGELLRAIVVAGILWPRHAVADLASGEHQAILFGTLTVGSSLGAVAGEPPTPNHPRGTLLIAWSLQGLGATLTEWDLARSRIVRQASLGDAEGSLSLARAGSWLHVAVESITPRGRRVSWALIDDSTLRLVRRVDLGAGANADVASDGTLAAVVWNASGPDAGTDAWTVTILDIDGRVLGGWHTVVPHSSPARLRPRARVAVLDGRTYVTLPGGPPCSVVALAPNGSVSRQISVASGTCGGSLVAFDGHLLVGADRKVEVFSPELDWIAGRPCESSMALFSVAAAGRAVTCDGEVLSSAFGVDARLRGLAWGSCLAALWSADSPVAILTSPKAGDVAWVDWLDPGAARGR